MRRTPSPRELVATLNACVEFEDEGDQELERLLVAYSPQLAEALCTTSARVEGLRTMSTAARLTRVRELVRAAKEQQRATNASAVQNLAMAAAAMLAKLARWEGDRVVLDERIVVGRSLLADRTRRYIRFDAEGCDPVVLRREKLVDAAKALRFSDLACSLDRRGLRFSWRTGAGGLLLVSQSIEPRHRDAVLSVVIERPRSARRQVAAVPPRERASSWAADVFNELGIF